MIPVNKAVAMGLAKEGAHLAICSRDAVRINAAAEEIRAATGAAGSAASTTSLSPERPFRGVASRAVGKIRSAAIRSAIPPMFRALAEQSSGSRLSSATPLRRVVKISSSEI